MGGSDRLAELRRNKAAARGADDTAGSGHAGDIEAGEASSSSAAPPTQQQQQPEQNPLDDFFANADDIQKNIQQVEANIQEMERIQSSIISNIIPEKQQQFSTQLEELIDNTNAMVTRSKQMLDAMEESNKKAEKDGVSTMSRIRENQHRQLSRDFVDTIRKFQNVQNTYRDKFKDRIRREVKIVNPDATEDEVEAAVDSGGTQVFADGILSEKHSEAALAYTMIQEQHRDIIRIEQSLAELHSLFVDMAALVDMQGEVLNNIEKNVSKAVSYTEQGVKELQKASKYQKKARKKMCILIILILIVAAAIVLPIVLSSSKGA